MTYSPSSIFQATRDHRDLPSFPTRRSSDLGPARIYYRDAGAGATLLFLHGGWGYEVYPFDRQIAALSWKFRILIRSEEHTSELQSHHDLVCRLLLEKKK